ncbi:MAG: ctpA [Candidatus Nomurabacteria bacterium]|nr:ctpA [Candidatus Nomurabacteria bacterium]
MNKNITQISLRVLGSIVIVAAVFFGGVYVGYGNQPAFAKVTELVHASDPSVSNADFEAFWKAWKLVNDNFAPGKDNTTPVSAQDRVYGAIQGMVAAYGDPYTTFFPPAQNTQFQAQIAGSFSGIGIQLGEKNDILTIIAPLKGTPAEKAGVLSGDKIVKINDTVTSNMTVDQAVALIQGKTGTVVTLTLMREGVAAPIVTPITRQTIDLPTVDTEMRSGDAFVIHLYNFSANSATLFKAAMDKYLTSGDHKLLIDLRGNPGGYLEAAVQIGSEFIPQGKVIVSEIGKDPKNVTLHNSTGPKIFPDSDKLIILADQGSASAAEILAGALSQQGIGVLVGQQTFGKGSVQQVISVTDSTALKVTVAHWYTPDGTSISAKGLTPKIVIPFDNKDKNDTQLQKAIDLFSSPATFQ